MDYRSNGHFNEDCYLQHSEAKSVNLTSCIERQCSFHNSGSHSDDECHHPKSDMIVRAVLMGTNSCTKSLNFSTRFSCENLAVEDFVTLLMGKKYC